MLEYRRITFEHDLDQDLYLTRLWFFFTKTHLAIRKLDL